MDNMDATNAFNVADIMVIE